MSDNFGGAFAAAYKRIYNPRKVQQLAYHKRPFLKELAKKDDFEGGVYVHAMFYEDPQGGSDDFSTAIAQKAQSSVGARMYINRGRSYYAISMSNEEIAAARSDMGSLLRKKQTETNNILEQMATRIDMALHGAGTGVLASFTTGASVATNVITLDIPQLHVRFGQRMTLQLATSNPTNGVLPANFLLNSGASVVVTGISRGGVASPTTITLDQNLNVAFPGIAAATQYFLLRKGDALGFGAGQDGSGVSGLKSWLPLVAPVAGDSFWGLDRSVDAQRLAGLRYIATNGEKYEATFQNASADLSLTTGTPSVILVHPNDFNKYSQELGNKVRFTNPGDKGTVGMTEMLVHGQSGDMRLLADPQVDPGLFYMLDMSTWYLKHLNGVPHLDDSDGRSAARESTTDAIEMRWRSWHQLICDAPGKNLVGTFSP